MLRAFFIVGASALLSAIVVAWGLLWLGRSTDTRLFGEVASTLVSAVLLLWVATMIGGITYRVIRYFAKPS